MTSICSIVALTLSLNAYAAYPPPAQDRAQAQTAQAPTVSGPWAMDVDSPHGPISMSIVLEQDGKKIKGTLTGGMGDRPVRGEYADGTLSLDTTDDEANVWSVSAKLSREGQLIGHLSTAQNDMKFTATRVKREK